MATPSNQPPMAVRPVPFQPRPVMMNKPNGPPTPQQGNGVRPPFVSQQGSPAIRPGFAPVRPGKKELIHCCKLGLY
jgi:hypothetical protein